MKEAILKGIGIAKSFEKSGRKITVLNGIDIEIYKGDLTVIMGSSGAGKSTLLYVLSGMDNLTSGEVSYKNKNISKLNEKAKAQIRADDFGFVFQQLNLVSSLTMAENVRVAGYAGGKFTRSEIDDRTEKLFTQMNMTEIMNNLPSEVSGGEAQRTAIARAVINSPEIIFADELNSLDEVKKVNTQKLIFTDYTVNGEKSDSQGQLIAYTPDKSGYKFFNDDLNGRINAPNKISDDEVYVSASMKSIYGTKIGRYN